MALKQYEFYGSSNDQFRERHTDSVQDDGGFGRILAYRIVDKKGQGVVVTGQYCPNYLTKDTWSIGVAKLDEDIDLSDDWKFELKPHSGYKNSLVVTAPADTKLKAV